jgi:hypothetical protein
VAKGFKQDQHVFRLLRDFALSPSVDNCETLSFELEVLQPLRTDCDRQHQLDWRRRPWQTATQSVLKRKPHLDQQNCWISQVEFRT